MPTDVIICDGCCCGRTEKGHPEVPIDFLLESWEKHGLSDSIKLRFSRCLGSCSKHNVSLLRTEDSQEWLGELSQIQHYEAIVEWACSIVKDGKNSKIPENLLPHKFQRSEEAVIREII